MLMTTLDDFLSFCWRAIGFVFVLAIFIIAGTTTSHNISHKKGYYESQDKLYRRRVTARVLFLIGIFTGAFLIWELCVNNPNEWLSMKISFYIFIWILSVFFCLWDPDSSFADQSILLRVVRVASYISLTVFFIAAFTSIVLNCSQPKTTVEREVVNSTKLVAANDAQQINGQYAIILFTISENNTYRYYYKTEKGGVKQGSVDAKDTTIYYIEDGEVPRLDYLMSYTYTIHKKNNKLHKEKYSEETWYELYVPKGSVAESYAFDLN